MDCSESITSEEYMDYIVQNIRVPSEVVCRIKVDENWSIVYGKSSEQPNMNIGNLEYRTIPKLYGLMDTEVLREQVASATMSDTSAYDSAGITALLNQPTLDIRGQGVLIGIIDTGACVIIMSSNIMGFYNNSCNSTILCSHIFLIGKECDFYVYRRKITGDENS